MICLIDPALQDHQQTPSSNLGDVVIFEAIDRCLQRVFPGEQIRRISSHEPLDGGHHEILAAARLRILGGSNLLASDLMVYNQWNFAKAPDDYADARITQLRLFGIGWWQYQTQATEFTAEFYRRVLSRDGLHSVRDSYTAAKLAQIGVENVTVTGCPSMWALDGVGSRRNDCPTNDCVVMLTDYKMDPAADNAILRLVLENFSGRIFFFPQGTGDVAYLSGLPAFLDQTHRFEVMQHSLRRLDRLLTRRAVTYVGTRLHGGIFALNRRVPSIILGVDNRALEMASDFHLPVVPRTDTERIRQWLEGEDLFPPIEVPRNNIERWWRQFGSPRGPEEILAAPRPYRGRRWRAKLAKLNCQHSRPTTCR